MDDSGRWARVTAVFQEALERDEIARAAYLDTACAGDEELRSEVESLLLAHHAAGGFVTGSPMDALSPSAVAVLGDDVANASLAPGTRLGPYEIVEPLSAGGMGELFRARDTRLGRDVAIKVPFAAAAGDRATRQRFQREARAIATLNHPHICTVHDVGSDSGVDYLVLELLQGETLASRLKRGPLPVDEALARAIEIAGALARAHKDGIIHRDLKPGNVMLTPSGVKVLDFGLARITRGDIDAPISGVIQTATPLTDAGAVLGTLQYMAPEQLEGRVADARADIYAFGATLYEMLTGKRAFEGSSSAAVIGNILRGETPSLLTMRPDLPPALDHVVRTCLEKDPEARFASLHDVTIALQWARTEARGSTSPAGDSHRPRSRRRAMLIGAAVAGCVVVAGVASWTMAGRTAADVQTVRFSIQPPLMPNSLAVAVSPDGETIAFSAAPSGNTTMLLVRPVGALQARTLAGTEGAFAPFWSPDGKYIGFATRLDHKLKIVDLAGGEPKVVCEIVDAPYFGASWSRDGVILVSMPGKSQGSTKAGPEILLHRVAATGGVPIPVGAIDRTAGENGQRWPYFLPDGRRFLYLASYDDPTKRADDPTKRAIFVGSLDSSDRTRVMSAESMAMYVPPHHLLFTRQGRLFAQGFDSSTMRVTGEPVAVADGLIYGGPAGRAAFSASSQTLVYRTGATGDGDASRFSLSWIDRNGTVSAQFPDTFDLPNIRLSPDATRVALIDRGKETGEDIWIYDLERDQKILFSGEPFADHYPVWSPDGSRIIFDGRGPLGVGRHLLYERRVDGAVPARLVLPLEPGIEYGAMDWTPKYFVFQQSRPLGQPMKPGERAGSELWAQPMSGERKPTLYVTGLASETAAALSPNGRWLAYIDREGGGGQDLIVRSFPNPSKSRHVISTSGACPRWRQDGRELYFLAPDGELTAVPVATEGDFAAGKSERLFTVLLRGFNPRFSAGPACPYDVRPDGQRFIVAQPGSAGREAPIQVVLNWMADLKP